MIHVEILATPSIKAGQGVWTFYAEVPIKAPAREVYDALRDFQSYKAWNQYMPKIDTPSGTNDIALGDMITLAYRPLHKGDTTPIPCKIVAVDDEEMYLSWRGCTHSIPTFILLPEKVHKVTPKGEDECLLQIWETQAGPMAYIVKWTMGKQLSDMTRGIVGNLKAYVEGKRRFR